MYLVLEYYSFRDVYRVRRHAIYRNPTDSATMQPDSGGRNVDGSVQGLDLQL